MASTIQTKCKNCNKKFRALTKEINRGNGKFCSRSCGTSFNKTKDKLPNTVCANCKESFYKKASRTSKSGLYFCCRLCKDTAQRIGGIKEIQPNHYGTRTNILSKDYRPLVIDPLKTPKCSACGWDKHYQILHVHHKDRNRKNNSIDNLEILCPTCHDLDHFLAGDGRFS